MSAFSIEPSTVTPRIVLDTAANRLVFEGDCYPENPVAFFAQFMQTLEAHLAAPAPRAFSADFRMRYVNSASTVTLQRIFGLLDRASGAGATVRIRWSFDPDDDVNEELGQDLARGCRFAEVFHSPSAEA